MTDAFSQRMAARKLKEAQEKAERNKEQGLEKFPVAIQFNILAKSREDADEALQMFVESMRGFSDISDVVKVEVV